MAYVRKIVKQNVSGPKTYYYLAKSVWDKEAGVTRPVYLGRVFPNPDSPSGFEIPAIYEHLVQPKTPKTRLCPACNRPMPLAYKSTICFICEAVEETRQLRFLDPNPDPPE